MNQLAAILDPSGPPRRRTAWQRIGWTAIRMPSLLVTTPRVAVGGQAVMEGVMMRGPHSWAVAVRRYDGTIAIQHRTVQSFAQRHRWARIPLVRGVVALIESLVIGMRALFVSSEYAIEGVEAQHALEQAGETPTESEDLHRVERAANHSSAAGAIGAPTPLPHDEVNTDPDPDRLSTWAIVVAMVIAMGFSIGLFKVVPVSLVILLPIDRGTWSFVLIEAGIKFAIFCVYLLLIGRMADMKRVFQYHSAEHKAINAWERGVPLEPDAVNEMSRIHVRCGTAFIVWLFIVGMLVFRAAQLTFLEDAAWWMIIAARPILLPVIAGLSFELLRFAGKHADSAPLRAVLAPGLWFQRLTTRECTPDQCEVAIASLNAVLEHEQSTQEKDSSASASGADEYEVLA